MADTNTDLNALRKDLDNLSAAVKELSKDVKETAKSTSEAFMSRASGKIGAVGEEAAHFAQKMAGRGRETAESVAEVARERPFQSMLVAFGIGMVVAKLLDRR